MPWLRLEEQAGSLLSLEIVFGKSLGGDAGEPPLCRRDGGGGGILPGNQLFFPTELSCGREAFFARLAKPHEPDGSFGRRRFERAPSFWDNRYTELQFFWPDTSPGVQADGAPPFCTPGRMPLWEEIFKNMSAASELSHGRLYAELLP